MIRALGIKILLLCSVPGFSQTSQLLLKHIGTPEGLSQNFVNSIIQDSKGFMWFGTLNGGLNKYDGYQFTTYKHIPSDKGSISSNQIRNIAEDKDGNLWIATGNGLNRFDRSTEKFTHYYRDTLDNCSLSINSVNTLFVDSDGDLWVGSFYGDSHTGGLNRFDKQKNCFTKYFKNEEVVSICEDDEKRLWIGTSNAGLFSFDKRTTSISKFGSGKGYPSITSEKITSVFFDQNKNLWIGFRDSGIDVVNLKTKKINHFGKTGTPSGLLSNDILVIKDDNEGRIWVGTENGGLSIFDNENTFKNFTQKLSDPSGLNSHSIYSLCRDEKHNMWIGTLTGGVNLFSSDANKFTYHTTGNSDELGSKTVFSITEDSEGNLLVGTDGGGVFIYNKERTAISNLLHTDGNEGTICGNHILSVLEDSKKNLWIGTWKDGVTVLNRKTNHFKHFKNHPSDSTSLGSNNAWVIFEDRANDIWIGTFWGGLSKFNRNNNSFKTLNKSDHNHAHIPSDDIIDICEDDEDNLWLGTYNGGIEVFNKNKNTFTQYIHSELENSLASNVVNSFYREPSGNLWIGTTNGLNYMDTKSHKFTNYSIKDGLPSNDIRSVMQDDSGNLWMGTTNGLATYNSKTKLFHIVPGISTTEFTQATYKNKQGQIFFGTVDGFIEFNPEKIEPRVYDPKILITNFLIFNNHVPIADSLHPTSPLKKSITETREITISYRESVISFEFASLNFGDDRNKQYSYKLIGFDDTWNFIGTRHSITYTNLDPGSYTLKIRGRNSMGNWSAKEATLQITITPPYWKTWWFKLITVLLAGSAFMGWYTIRVASIKRQKKELEKVVIERTFELEKLYTETKDSIRAAQTIQDSLLPSTLLIEKYLPQFFIFNKPKDIVSGDFYWFCRKNEKIIIATADCTGHGVSGAFMSINAYHLLNNIILNEEEIGASKILDRLNENIINNLHGNERQNGMDIALCIVDHTSRWLQYAGACSPLYIVRNGELIQLKADPYPIGFALNNFAPYSVNNFKLEKNDTVYMFSDGYPDQIGGLDQKKFSYKQFRDLLIQSSILPMKEQANLIEEKITKWRGNHEQLDDMLILGFKVD